MMSEKIRITLVKKKMPLSTLAKALGSSRSNLSNKLARDNFSEKELRDIAEILGCDLDMHLVMRDTGEKI